MESRHQIGRAGPANVFILPTSSARASRTAGDRAQSHRCILLRAEFAHEAANA